MAQTPAPDLLARFGVSLPITSEISGRPLSERYVNYVEGPIETVNRESDGWRITIAHQHPDGGLHRYSTLLRGEWLPEAPTPQIGTTIGLIARPVDEEDRSDDIGLESYLVFDRSRAAPGFGLPIWAEGGDPESWLNALSTLWVFTVYGSGGADGLGVPAPQGLQGRPIALWGGWQPAPHLPAQIQFTPQEPPYEWLESEELYRQPDN